MTETEGEQVLVDQIVMVEGVSYLVKVDQAGSIVEGPAIERSEPSEEVAYLPGDAITERQFANPGPPVPEAVEEPKESWMAMYGDQEEPGEPVMGLGDDPGDFTVPQVNAYLATLDSEGEEHARVIAAEQADKQRVGILEN